MEELLLEDGEAEEEDLLRVPLDLFTRNKQERDLYGDRSSI